MLDACLSKEKSRTNGMRDVQYEGGKTPRIYIDTNYILNQPHHETLDEEKGKIKRDKLNTGTQSTKLGTSNGEQAKELLNPGPCRIY
jgi:hypothetical protein